MKTIEEKYCEEFGLCQKDGKCQCKDELKFIRTEIKALIKDIIPDNIETEPKVWQGFKKCREQFIKNARERGLNV